MFNLISLFRGNKVLDKSVLLNPLNYLQKEKVYLEKLGGYVWVRELTAKEAMIYDQTLKDAGDVNMLKSLELICLMVSFGVCDENGNSIYTQSEVETLQLNSYSTVLALFNTITKLNNSKGFIKTVNKMNKNK